MIAENLVAAALLAVSGALTFVAWRSWRYTPTPRVFWLATAFSLLAGKALVLAVALFATPDWQRWMLATLTLDLVALGAFYRATL